MRGLAFKICDHISALTLSSTHELIIINMSTELKPVTNLKDDWSPHFLPLLLDNYFLASTTSTPYVPNSATHPLSSLPLFVFIVPSRVKDRVWPVCVSLCVPPSLPKTRPWLEIGEWALPLVVSPLTRCLSYLVLLANDITPAFPLGDSKLLFLPTLLHTGPGCSL